MLFSNITGYTSLKEQLVRSVTENRISHAQLFHAPPGSNALAMAVAYARFVLCKNRGENDSCGTCPSCIKINGLAHPDLHFSFPTLVKDKEDSASADNVKTWRDALKETPFMDLRHWASLLEDENKIPIIHVKEAGSILGRLALKSYEGGFKILVMWMPESMNTETANKLLKILEEPPEQTLFVLVSFRPEALLPTIISRTQVIKFPTYTEEEITAWAMQKYSLPEAGARGTAMLAEGNMMEAWRFIQDQEEGNTWLVFFRDWMRRCYKFSPVELFAMADEFADFGKVGQRTFLQYAARMFRESMMMNYTGGELNRITEEEAAFLQNFGKYIGGNNIAYMLEEIDQVIYHIERNVNARMAFINLSMKMKTYLRLPYPEGVE
jgi:DNA polymerase III subunit delta'